MYWLIIALCVVGFVLGYLIRVKAKKAWGTVLLVACIVGALGAIGLRVSDKDRDKNMDELLVVTLEQEQERARIVGEQFRGRLPEGAAITVVWAVGGAKGLSERRESWERGVRQGSQDEALRFRHFPPPSAFDQMPPEQVESFSVIRGADAVIYRGYFAELPAEGKPVIAVHFSRLPSGNPTIARHKVQALVDAGRIDVGVWENERGESVVITPEERGEPVEAAPEDDGEPAMVTPKYDEIF